MLGKIGFIALAVASAAIGAHALNPRELYHEMYPLEPVKRDAFRICDEADPTFIRAAGADREACYNKMPHVMAVAMGRIKAAGTLTVQALTDPSREAELLMTLAAMPPRQPITAPRSFSNTAWALSLSPPCADKHGILPAAVHGAPTDPRVDAKGAAALGDAYRNNLARLPHVASAISAAPLPPIPLASGQVAAASQPNARNGKTPATAIDPLPAADLGDETLPAIVPLAPTGSCGA